MSFRDLLLLTAFTLALSSIPARAQDVTLCFATADRVTSGETLTEEEKQTGHEACQRALAATSSVIQKYHIQEADFDIVGRPPKPKN